MINGFILLGGSLLLLGLLYHEKTKKQKSIIINKTILSLLFVITAFLQPYGISSYSNDLLIGLILCLIGDICLALPGEKIFKAGLGAFLFGHVFYIFSFSSLLRISLWITVGGFVICCISAWVFFWLRPYLKSMLGPVLVYILVITVMLGGAWGIFQQSSFPVSGRVLVFIGALCFYLSDIFVARDKFIREEFRNRLIGLPLYYAGQFSLAFSVGVLG
jgi:uncharacterized membrane protein YhhN